MPICICQNSIHNDIDLKKDWQRLRFNLRMATRNSIHDLACKWLWDRNLPRILWKTWIAPIEFSKKKDIYAHKHEEKKRIRQLHDPAKNTIAIPPCQNPAINRPSPSQPLPRSCPNPPTQKLPWKCTQNHHIHTCRQKVMQHWYRRVSNELSHRSFWLLNIKANCVSYRVAVSLGRIECSTKRDYVSQSRNWYGPKMVLNASVSRVCASI